MTPTTAFETIEHEENNIIISNNDDSLIDMNADVMERDNMIVDPNQLNTENDT